MATNIISISDQERKADYQVAEHANTHYNYWLAFRNQGRSDVNGVSVDERLRKHERVQVQLATKYGVTCLAGELLSVIKGEKVSVQID